MRKTTLIAVVILILLGWIFFSNPGSVALNEKGKAEGIVNGLRSALQGKRFWKHQYEIASRRFAEINIPAKPSSAGIQELYRKYREAENELDQLMKPLYSPAEQLAQTLRIKADSLDRAAKWNVIDDAAEAARRAELEKLKVVIPILELKLGITPSHP
jgi:hypothetical protein